jgi:lipopolysaccharide transport system ATP-binding protein
MSRAEIKQKFDEIVSFAEVERFLDTPVKRYSSGMYVRLAFAVAAHLEPEILIIDEVLAVGDVEFQKKCLGKMSDAADQGKTVLFVSHNLKAVEHFCTRGLLLEGGSLVIHGTAYEAVTEYLRRNAASLGPDGFRELDDELDLVVFRLSKTNVSSKEVLEFLVEFSVKRDCKLHDLHLFFNNAFGDRVAIIDLRDASISGGTRELAAGHHARFAGRIESIPLIPSHYRVGLCSRTSRHFEVLHDLADLQVSNQVGGNLVPYAPEYQGTTILEYEYTVEFISSVASREISSVDHSLASVGIETR